MDWRAECAAVIPCLNEAAGIGPLVEGVRRHLQTVVVVDDGSSDGTGPAAERAGAEVLKHARTQGKGAALQTGWAYARKRGLKWALSMDGDGQHSPEDIPSLFQCAERGSARLVVGNRMNDTARMPWLRRWVNCWMSNRISVLARRPLPDSQCGFRLMDLERSAGLAIHTTHFEIESEVLLAFIRAGLAVEFIPIRSIYKDEQSKIHVLRDTARWVLWWRKASGS